MRAYQVVRLCGPRPASAFVSSAPSRISRSNVSYRYGSTSATTPPSKTRNIGIIAHIDAGKTTTTERMLYYSGFTRRLGDVDDGSTVTDFLPAERARGITIQSAAVTFSWPPATGTAPVSLSSDARFSITPHIINLIDTPGHADFTFEVLRSLRILDGAVCILDGVAGVEAQTEQVWKQANHYRIPRLIFVNKLDRDGAAFARTVREIGTRLGMWPAICQIPWWSPGAGQLQGVGDVLGLRGLLYETGGDGRNVRMLSMDDLRTEDASFAQELMKARIALVELLSEHDDDMVEHFLEAEEDHIAISELDLVRSLRKLTLGSPQLVTPVFSGASFRNIGVQPLLDAVVDFLPSPEQRPDPEVAAGEQQVGLNALLAGKAKLGIGTPGKSLQKARAVLDITKLATCALAFKVVSDLKRGILVYVRVYSGRISRMMSLYNTNLGVVERPLRLLRMHANDAVEVDTIEAGQIGVLPGLKFSRTGDTLISYAGANSKTGPPPPLNEMQLRPIGVPPPVFFTSVEPNSLAEEGHLNEQLAILLREDPSLNVVQDTESGQTHLSGMGELHLEIARDRLVEDFGAKARVSSIRIGYRESCTSSSPEATATCNREVAGRTTSASCSASIEPRGEDDQTLEDGVLTLPDENRLVISTPDLDENGSSLDADKPSLPETLSMSTLTTSLRSGVLSALSRGPTHAFPMHSTTVRVVFDTSKHLTHNTTPAALSAAARQAVTEGLESSAVLRPTVLMEPVMHVSISVDEPSLGAVVHDISASRGGQILALDDAGPSGVGVGEDGRDGGDQTPVIDASRIYAPPDPFAGSGEKSGQAGMSEGATRMRQIVARVPLKEMVGYLKHLRSLTGGRGTFVMRVDRFERMAANRMKVALAEMRGAF